MEQFQNIIERPSINDAELRSILGRLENVATIISMFGHFFNNIRSLQIKAAAKTHNVKIPNRVKEDLKLCKLFLKRARDGVSMNVITFRKPSICSINDAAEHGLGGFADHGRA